MAQYLRKAADMRLCVVCGNYMIEKLFFIGNMAKQVRKVVDIKICAICHSYGNQKVSELPVKIQKILFLQ